MDTVRASVDELITTDAQLETILAGAESAMQHWGASSREFRAAALESVADGLHGAADDLVPLAMTETRLPEQRLRGELARTEFQLRLFAEVLREGGYLDARIDHADPEWGMGPRPDIRRILQPIGPVLVFAASNFPFAFSVAGGDTASALAAGCPVVVKAHPGHPALSARTAEVVSAALLDAGAEQGVFAVVFGNAAGTRAISDGRIAACGFTGSVSGGRALFDLAMSRPEPIPFYGELGSVNPAFVTQRADTARADDIATGFIGSFALGAGQFCTKPGLLFAPEGGGVDSVLRTARLPAAAPLLNERIRAGFVASAGTLAEHPSVSVMRPGRIDVDPPEPTLFTTTIGRLLDDIDALADERFGPAALVVTYRDEDDLLTVARRLPGQLTAAVHAEEDDPIAARLIPVLAKRAGRVLWNEWPTGVTVSHAQQHGGPYPATTAVGTTSVGTAAITRFLRPVAYQGMPSNLLPAELRDDGPPVPRRLDGALVIP
ncbi:aldehyde dehydrogenase (NADP(+)) [Jiangella asiatica]|uniref:Aldehyde dehydrogenase (NADP(+)) n=1 Tax=Jiangella asiatica TaxID=2530372 RepID=A0A4R5D4W4_9ACTN|nr:aldehyde dehydrogenase (NADP(+)) [Jiangella asiatica]TDE08366.1 aldehyde dehydrogenase (NADP(+)) [Jiangella asiatica]